LKWFRIFSYSSTLINSKKVINEEVKSRIAAGKRCFFRLRQIFRSRAMGKAVKIMIYRMIVKPVLVFRSETWASGRTRNLQNKN